MSAMKMKVPKFTAGTGFVSSGLVANFVRSVSSNAYETKFSVSIFGISGGAWAAPLGRMRLLTQPSVTSGSVVGSWFLRSIAVRICSRLSPRNKITCTALETWLILALGALDLASPTSAGCKRISNLYAANPSLPARNHSWSTKRAQYSHGDRYPVPAGSQGPPLTV